MPGVILAFLPGIILAFLPRGIVCEEKMVEPLGWEVNESWIGVEGTADTEDVGFGQSTA